ncbi:MAG: S-methyl-5-thioribose-1-phosphate isomerase, partial [Eggerthellaceae bacterium]|nr:S-methyl-5-thioribose-1-phosphate isomerase [Eggerthellaceae bacterium]
MANAIEQALPRTLDLRFDEEARCAVLRYVDQNRLPLALAFEKAHTAFEVIEALKALSIRGAPAIGVAGAAAIVLFAFNESSAPGSATLLEELKVQAQAVAAARPTAVNLAWGVGKVMRLAEKAAGQGVAQDALKQALFDEVKAMEAEDEACNRRIGAVGAALIPKHARVLTHCNAGSLATVFFGTALGVVYTAAAEGGVERVYACETRPLGQGARLTTWELSRMGIPCTLLCDDMAAVLMAQGKVDVVLVGADRICANGD